jgi:hypothetical protein
MMVVIYARSHSLEGCGYIDDNGLKPIARSIGKSLTHVSVNNMPSVTAKSVAELVMRGNQMRIVEASGQGAKAFRTKLKDVQQLTSKNKWDAVSSEPTKGGHGLLIISQTVAKETETKNEIGDINTATGQLTLLLYGDPEASSIILPGSVEHEQLSLMVLLALNKLSTLVHGGLQLNKMTGASVSIDLAVAVERPEGVNALSEWMSEKHFEVLFSIPGDRIVSLNLSGTRMGKVNGAEQLAIAFESGSMQSLTELDVSENDLRSDASAHIARALR